ncbi:hypothetical protein BKA82DRAFT_4180694 [Pisolithus tinctorius]|nr:hypothetical protein BKA82DRAFT_4180694 [Pisolithus tinctorius]
MTLIHTHTQGTQLSQRIHPTLTTAQRHVVDFCSKGPGTYIVPSSPGSQVFVKRGNPNLEAEARTQAHLYAQAQSSAFNLHVPKVYDVFNDGNCNTYLVMEYIPAPSFHAWISEPDLSAEERSRRTDVAIDAIANTVEVLLQCPLPEGNGIGPVGGGYIQHSFFCMEEAPISFVDAAALGKYVNKALKRRPRQPQDRVSLDTEARLLCPSDDSVNERVWMVDYQHVNVLPHSFASFYFHSAPDPFVEAVAKKISLPVSSQLNLLQSAAVIVIQSGIRSFGLDENGDVKSRR